MYVHIGFSTKNWIRHIGGRFFHIFTKNPFLGQNSGHLGFLVDSKFLSQQPPSKKKFFTRPQVIKQSRPPGASKISLVFEYAQLIGDLLNSAFSHFFYTSK